MYKLELPCITPDNKPDHIIDVRGQLWSRVTINEINEDDYNDRSDEFIGDDEQPGEYLEEDDYQSHIRTDEYHLVVDSPPLRYSSLSSRLVAITTDGQLYDLYKRQVFSINDMKFVQVFDITMNVLIARGRSADLTFVITLNDKGEVGQYIESHYKTLIPEGCQLICPNTDNSVTIFYNNLWGRGYIGDKDKKLSLQQFPLITRVEAIGGDNLPKYEDVTGVRHNTVMTKSGTYQSRPESWVNESKWRLLLTPDIVDHVASNLILHQNGKVYSGRSIPELEDIIEVEINGKLETYYRRVRKSKNVWVRFIEFGQYRGIVNTENRVFLFNNTDNGIPVELTLPEECILTIPKQSKSSRNTVTDGSE